ncbi:MAG: glycosyltransferase family 87 protein [Terriglobales bacterium]
MSESIVSQERHVWMVIAAVVCAAGVWLFAERVFVPYQKTDAAVHGRPRGNLSDLYPRWLGARELLLDGRDPYSAEVSREIQAGYYGRPLDSSRPGEPRDQQRFAYPAYVVFYLAPTVRLPFAIVRAGFFWSLVFFTAASALIWVRVLGWPTSLAARVVVLMLTLGSLAVMQGLKLEQISLLVAALIAIAVWLLARDFQVAAGIVLAVASVKPQIVILLLIWLSLWTVGDFRRRYRWAVSFGVAMAIQIAASEWYLPHWIPRFWQAVLAYKSYTGAVGVAEEFAGPTAGRALELLAFLMLMELCWRERRHAAHTKAFARMVSLVLALVVLLVPTYSVYNQVLLIPAVLVLAGASRALWRRGFASRFLLLAVAALVGWPWIASVALAGLSFILPHTTVEQAWAAPFWTVLFVPVGVAALMLVYVAQQTFGGSTEAGTS